jgi:hypothetical protein
LDKPVLDRTGFFLYNKDLHTKGFDMAFNQHADPKDNFGQDLIQIFGPRTARKHISKLTPAEKEAILDKVPEYVETDDLGPRPSFYQVANKILLILKNTKALNGIDLNWCMSLSNGGIFRDPSHYIHTAKAYKNNSVQRGIQLRHLLQDILFEFEPSHVLMGLARQLSDGTYNLNNGQHRTLACIIIGVREVPVEWKVSDFESVDVDLYATDNLHTLSASPFDEFRIKVRRNQVRKAEGRTDLIAEDIKCEHVFDIHARYGSRFVEKGKGTDNVLPKECTGVGNMLKYYDVYGADIYERAVGIVCSIFAKAPFSTANAWGIMEYLREQENNGPISDSMELDWNIQEAITYKYTDPVRSGMHLDIKKVFREFLENNAKAGKFLDCSEPRYLAAGIGKLCKIVHPTINWAPINYNGQDVEVALAGFKAIPKKP